MSRARDIANLIGGATPDIILKTATGAILDLQTSDTTVTDGSILGKINFTAPDEASGTDAILLGASIEGEAEDTFDSSTNSTSLVFKTGASAAADEKMRLTSGGSLVIGHNKSDDGSFLANSAFQVVGTSATTAHIGITRFSNNAFPPSLFFAKSRSGSIGTDTVVQDDDELGQIGFAGADGTDLSTQGATIKAAVDGTPGGNDLPTRLVFSTTGDGNASVTERMRLDSSGNLGIACTPDVLLDVGDSDNGSAGNTGIQIQNSQDFSTVFDATNGNTWAGIQTVNHDDTSNNTATGIVFVHRSSSSGIAAIQSTSSAADRADLRFITRGSDGVQERFVIQNDGKVGINDSVADGRLSILDSSNPVVFIQQSSTSDDDLMILRHQRASTSTNNATVISFRASGGGEVGSIKLANNDTLYDTTSDYRLKENVNYDWDATTKLKQLKPCEYNWISDEDNTVVTGFLAHEAKSVINNAVSGEKDATKELKKVVYDTDGNIVRENVSEEKWTAGKESGLFEKNTTWHETKTVPDYQGIDQSKLVPLLTKSLQEAIAKIETLETKVAALEAE